MSGGRSSKANEKIQSLGFKNVYELNWGAEKLRDDITCLALDLKNTEVIPIKAEKIENKKFDIILARAVSQLNHLLSISYNICKKNTTLLLHKGVHIDEEIVQATKYWDFTHVLHENEREKGSFILELKNIIKSIT